VQLVSAIGYDRSYRKVTVSDIETLVGMLPKTSHAVAFSVLRRSFSIWLLTHSLGKALGNMALAKVTDLAQCVASASQLREARTVKDFAGCSIPDFHAGSFVSSDEFRLAMVAESFQRGRPWAIPGLIRDGVATNGLPHTFERYKRIFCSAYRNIFYSQCFTACDTQQDVESAFDLILGFVLSADCQLFSHLLQGQGIPRAERTARRLCAAAVCCELIRSEDFADIVCSLSNGANCLKDYHKKRFEKSTHAVRPSTTFQEHCRQG
jgi:hypothetical protein